MNKRQEPFNMNAPRTSKRRQQFVNELEKASQNSIYYTLREEPVSELYAMHAMASRRLKDLIDREIRNTEV